MTVHLKILGLLPLVIIFGSAWFKSIANKYFPPTPSILKSYGKVAWSVTPPIIRDIPRLFVDVPVQTKTKPTNISHVQVTEIKHFLPISIAAYCPYFFIFSVQCLCEENYTDVTYVEDNDFDSLVLIAADKERKRIVISYRATYTFLNWKINFDYQLIDVPNAPNGVRVHHGFYNYFLSSYHNTRIAVSKLLDNPQYKDYSVLITGYSLGAAVATVSVHDWVQFFESHTENWQLDLISYASPRVGNSHFANYLAELPISLTRYTYQNDLVVHLPPRSFGYVHIGVEIHQLNNNLNPIVCSQQFDEDPECSYKHGFLSSWNHFFPFHNFIPYPPYC